MSERVGIRDILAESGSKKFGFARVGETATSVVELPVGIVNGSQTGPTLLVTAGTHACEYAGIEAALRIYQHTNPARLRGTVIVVPVINTPGFYARTPFVCPIDGVNIGRAYPGDPNRSISYRIAHFVVDEIVSKSDCWIDLHGGDVPEMVMPGGYSMFWREKDEDLARAFGTKYVSKRISEDVGHAKATDKTRIPVILAEAGGLATCEESDIKVHEDGVLNIMTHLKMVEGVPRIPLDQKVLDKTFEVFVNRAGIFYSNVRAGDRVRKGQVLGEIRNLKGEVLEQITSPENGLIRIWVPGRIKNTGDRVYGGYVL